MRAYLEAPDRTQDLLTIKWALRSAGYSIGSTWHDMDANTWPAFKHHWNASSMEQLQRCDSLIVVSGTRAAVTPELALMAGFALARGIRVFWIGSPVRAFNDIQGFTEFDRPESFERELPSIVHSELNCASKQVAA